MLTSNPLFWGHNLEDYCEMFALSAEDLTKSIIDCGGGPASFNAQMQHLHHRVISVDKVYGFDLEELEQHVADTYESMLAQIAKEKDRYIWNKIPDLDSLAAHRRTSTHLFLEDFPVGAAAGRYLPLALANLPFSALEFDLALCSHYLFVSRVEPNLQLHLQIIHELLRVANEVRIFPLLDSSGNVSTLIGPLMLCLQQSDLVGVEIKEVPYQFQKQGNAMLRVWRQTCSIEDVS